MIEMARRHDVTPLPSSGQNRASLFQVGFATRFFKYFHRASTSGHSRVNVSTWDSQTDSSEILPRFSRDSPEIRFRSLTSRRQEILFQCVEQVAYEWRRVFQFHERAPSNQRTAYRQPLEDSPLCWPLYPGDTSVDQWRLA